MLTRTLLPATRAAAAMLSAVVMTRMSCPLHQLWQGVFRGHHHGIFFLHCVGMDIIDKYQGSEETIDERHRALLVGGNLLIEENMKQILVYALFITVS